MDGGWFGSFVNEFWAGEVMDCMSLLAWPSEASWPIRDMCLVWGSGGCRYGVVECCVLFAFPFALLW